MTPHMRAGQPAPRFGAAIPSSGRSGPAGLARRGRRPTPTPTTPTPLGSDIDMHGPAEARISCAGASPLSTLSLPFHAFLRSPMESNVTSSSFNYKNHCYAEKICSDIHQTIAPGGLSIDRSVFNSRQIVVWFEALSGGKQALLACAPTPTGRPGRLGSLIGLAEMHALASATASAYTNTATRTADYYLITRSDMSILLRTVVLVL